jgi:hypothetical protein
MSIFETINRLYQKAFYTSNIVNIPFEAFALAYDTLTDEQKIIGANLEDVLAPATLADILG